ncbi:MAG: hypothetical protein ACK559_19690, partial [bacterium]
MRNFWEPSHERWGLPRPTCMEVERSSKMLGVCFAMFFVGDAQMAASTHPETRPRSGGVPRAAAEVSCKSQKPSRR